jgi:hypothetical protein
MITKKETAARKRVTEAGFQCSRDRAALDLNLAERDVEAVKLAARKLRDSEVFFRHTEALLTILIARLARRRLVAEGKTVSAT